MDTLFRINFFFFFFIFVGVSFCSEEHIVTSIMELQKRKKNIINNMNNILFRVVKQGSAPQVLEEIQTNNAVLESILAELPRKDFLSSILFLKDQKDDLYTCFEEVKSCFPIEIWIYLVRALRLFFPMNFEFGN